jgi:hypothetical protein
MTKSKSNEAIDMNFSIENILRDFEEFLENFADYKTSQKYEGKVIELVEASEHILDIRSYNLSLKESLDHPGHYKILGNA